ncbi:MAG TPA: FGGY family carbohydrate kinase [Candidatus Paceibacterota bacterium]
MNNLVLDVGTTNIKAAIFDESFRVVSSGFKEISKKVKDGTVEQDPKEILAVSVEMIKKVVRESGIDLNLISGWGMTVQRETVVVWNGKTGEPAYPAISWEDNRTVRRCADVQKTQEKTVREKTGLLVSPYFSASKISWILEHVGHSEELLWGTVDVWIMWNLLNEKPYITDYTNASRTMLFNINDLSWDAELFNIWNIRKLGAPKAVPSLSQFGTLKKSTIGVSLPLVAVCGDQQASVYGALKRGADTKITFGTGTFLVQVLKEGFTIVQDFFTTLLPTQSGASYGLEAKIGEYGQEVARLRERGLSLENLTKTIAESVKPWIRKLPTAPKKIVIDGGITQSPFLLSALRATLPDVTFIEQTIYDGTALGAAYMVFDSLGGQK